ncbi:KDO2-lipid IV(A) lauroyltransferase [Thermodesulfovibrio aggregans]|uniref:KDO2-lipid IV(A) lauroyltransferase n=1 Tax=Thermodesulfovibrio aggregans TaxID=86166 RepID=A0A0U9HUI9_9BACT|nr:lysophospholipid acyltransferase family protein [Thermodesulfovibrio aggregans]GAQ94285.1 KDO2-lipid IV(A) lauroyltransferase [Thermodesulfovibrio aggregans]
MKSFMKHTIFKYGLKLFFWLGKILKRHHLQNFSKLLGSFLYFIPWSRKKIAFENLKIAFQVQYNKKELKKILKNFIQEVILTALEIAFIVKKKEKLASWAKADGLEILDEALKQKKGVIALSGHIGNIPVMLAWLAEKGYPVAVLFKEGKYLPRGFLYNLINSYKIFPIPFRSDREVPKEIIKALNKNMIVFILADQARPGVYAKFFGKKVQCQKGAFVIALRKGCPIVPVFIVRENEGHRIKIYKKEKFLQLPALSRNDSFSLSDKSIVDMIEEYNSLLEKLISQHPEQYYWFHRRFKKSLP